MGVEVDIASGLPKEMLKQQREQRIIQQGAQLAEELQGESGQRFLVFVLKRLTDRMEALIQQDAYCQGLLNSLSDMGMDIKAAQRVANKVITDRINIEITGPGDGHSG